MKKSLLTFCFLFIIICANAQVVEAITEAPPKPNFGDGVVQPALAAKAETVARQWLEALAQNNIEKILPLTGFPFAWDRVEIISDKEVFRKKLQLRGNDKKMPAKEAAALLESLTMKTVTSRRTILDKLIPIDVYIIGFSIKQKGKTDGGRITVQMSPQLAVTGLSD